MSFHWTKLPTPAGAPLGAWRELPVNFGQFDDCAKLHAAAAALSHPCNSAERRYVAGMDLLTAEDRSDVRRAVIRFLPASGVFADQTVLEIEDVPLVPFDEGIRIEFAFGACILRRDRKTGQRQPFDEKFAWEKILRLKKTLACGGLDIEEIDIVGEIRRFAVRHGTRISLPETRCAGTAKISDAAAFAELLVSGIGKSRAFGLGLFQYRPL